MATKDEARAVKRRMSRELLGRGGVLGVGTEREGDGWVVVLHVDPEQYVPGSTPEELDGVPVRLFADAPFEAYWDEG